MKITVVICFQFSIFEISETVVINFILKNFRL